MLMAFVGVAVMFVGGAVMVMGGAVSEGVPQSLLRTNNKDGHTYNHVTDSHNYNTSLHNQGSFYSIVNQNGNIHKLLKTSIGTGVMDKVIQYVFDKMGTRHSRSFGTAYLGNHDNHQPSTNRFHRDESTYTSYSGDYELRMREPVKAPNKQAIDDGACIDMYTSFHSSSLCLDVSTAFAIAALAVLLQIFFSFSVHSFCPTSNSFGNFDDVIFSVRNENNITVESDGGSQTQSEFQTQDQAQFENQNQDQEQQQFQAESQIQIEEQSQGQNQFQSESQSQNVTLTDRRSLNENYHRSGYSKGQLRNIVYGDKIYDFEDLYDYQNHPQSFNSIRSENISSPFLRSGQGEEPVNDQEGGNSSRDIDVLTSVRGWSLWPMWQEMTKSFTESRFFPKASLCPTLRGFVSG